MSTPRNKREDIVEEINGIRVADPYRWLEDAEDPEVQAWIKKQNEELDTQLKGSEFEVFSKELAESFKVTTYSNPTPVHGKYFYVERAQDEDQFVLYMKNGLDGTPVTLFNPNGQHEGNTVTIDYWEESATGKYIAYGISQGGDEMATLFLKDTDTNQELEEKIVRCRYSQVRWLPDDSGFFYTRNPRPGTVPTNEEYLHVKVYFHKLGDDPDTDEMVFGADRPKDDMVSIDLSPDGTYLCIQASQEWSANDVFVYNRETKELRPLIVGIPSKFSCTFLKDRLLIETNYKANNSRVLWNTYDDLYKPIDEWREFIPEKEFMLESISVTNSKVFLQYLVNVSSEVSIFDYEGVEVGKLPLPPYSSLAGISSRKVEEEFFYSVDSFLFPRIFYRYDPNTKEYLEYRKTETPLNPDDYEVRQEWYASKDGTKVPMFILHKKGIELNGSNPTVLYGYGGFGSNVTPAFMRGWAPWIEKGGIYVIANIRGGAEFGEKWHKDGIKDKKQNSFDDFIAAAEYLISKNYTSVEHLGITGASNGGLLVSAVGVQRPDLFKSVCSKVPLTDMVRFPKFGMAVRWVHEYGNPNNEEDLKNILTWSPYHNVKVGTKYPDFLFTTANKDTRVYPFHSRKMAAVLQDAHEHNTALVLTEMDAGHGAGKPVIKIVESQAIALAFFAKTLGLLVR